MALTATEKQKLRDIARELRLTVIDVMAWSGGAHVGGSLSCMDILTILYFKYLNIDPSGRTATGSSSPRATRPPATFRCWPSAATSPRRP